MKLDDIVVGIRFRHNPWTQIPFSEYEYEDLEYKQEIHGTWWSPKFMIGDTVIYYPTGEYLSIIHVYKANNGMYYYHSTSAYVDIPECDLVPLRH